jgi:RNA polymerase sigma factor (sigma-70 family)
MRVTPEDPLRSLYERTCGPMTRLATGILGDRDQAADAVHAVFTKLAAKMPSVPSIRNRYLYVAIRNECFREIARQRRITALPFDILAHLDVATPEKGPEGEVEASEIIDHYLKALPPRCRAIALLWLQGYAYQEISAMLGIARNTVNAQVQRALKLLRRIRERERPMIRTS